MQWAGALQIISNVLFLKLGDGYLFLILYTVYINISLKKKKRIQVLESDRIGLKS